MKESVERALAAFARKGFDTKYFETAAEAAEWLAEQVAEGEEVAFGGSVTLRQLDLAAKITARGGSVINHWREGQTAEERADGLRRPFRHQHYFLSANALTEDGLIYNVDGTGNRVTTAVFGPQQVFVVAGENKVVADINAAVERVRTIAAPKNAARLNKQTPCVKTGTCMNCQSPQRICRVYTVTAFPPYGTKTTIVLIGEELGY